MICKVYGSILGTPVLKPSYVPDFICFDDENRLCDAWAEISNETWMFDPSMFQLSSNQNPCCLVHYQDSYGPTSRMASHTPSKINIEPENDGLVQMIFLFRGVKVLLALLNGVGSTNQLGWMEPMTLSFWEGYRPQWKDSHKGLVYLDSNIP